MCNFILQFSFSLLFVVFFLFNYFDFGGFRAQLLKWLYMWVCLSFSKDVGCLLELLGKVSEEAF